MEEGGRVREWIEEFHGGSKGEVTGALGQRAGLCRDIPERKAEGKRVVMAESEDLGGGRERARREGGGLGQGRRCSLSLGGANGRATCTAQVDRIVDARHISTQI